MECRPAKYLPLSARFTRSNIFRLALCCIALALAVVAAIALYISTHLTVSHTPQNADFIVVLGGGADRHPVAAKLFHAGFAKRILISGSPEECNEIAENLSRLKVPKDAILFEDKSTSTRTNAINSGEILSRLGARKIILVTSWYHSSRSLRTFKKYAPRVEILSVPSQPPARWASGDYDCAKFELLKSFRNWWLYGIPLW